MKNVQTIVTELGGSTIVANKLGTTAQAVSNMMTRNRIKPEYWRKLLAFADECKYALTADELMKIHENP